MVFEDLQKKQHFRGILSFSLSYNLAEAWPGYAGAMR